MKPAADTIADVAIQGEEGSNSAAAARALLGAESTLLPCETFAGVFQALVDRRVTTAVLPIENTTVGLVQEVWDRLLGIEPAPPLWARAEARVRISFCVAGLPGSRGAVRGVLAHPVAAAQCRRHLSASGLEVLPCHDTAGAARLVRERGDASLAALCPPSAATYYDLEIIAADCGDAARTWTRFLALSPSTVGDDVGAAARLARDDDARSLLALEVPERPGSLARALDAFAYSGVNLCALHSRAVPGHGGKYVFLVEVEAGARSPALQQAIGAARADKIGLRVLGSFSSPPWPEAPALTSSMK